MKEHLDVWIVYRSIAQCTVKNQNQAKKHIKNYKVLGTATIGCHKHKILYFI